MMSLRVGPHFSMKKFSRNLSYFNNIWSEDLGQLSKDEVSKMCNRDTKVKYLETDIYLMK